MRNSNNLILLKDLIKERIRTIYVTVSQKNQEHLFKKEMQELWDFISSINSPSSEFYPIYEDFIQDEYYEEAKRELSYLQSVYEEAVELEDVYQLLRHEIKIAPKGSNFHQLIESKYGQATFESTIKEFESIHKFLPNNKVVNKFIMVGCGPLAQTLIHFGLTYRECQCYGIDKSIAAVESLTKLLKHIKAKNIFCDLSDGTIHNYKDYDVIFIANFAHPKQVILKRVLDTARSSSIVTVRLPVLYSNLFYDYVDIHAFNKVVVLSVLPNNGKLMNKTIIMKIK